MTKEMTVSGFHPNSYAEIEATSRAMAQSGYFQDVKAVSQAIVKVMAGSELGLPPFAAMTGIHIIQGKPALGANLIATLIKNDPRYNYKVIEHTDAVCKIEFFENGESSGFSEFNTDDAKKAGTKNMNKFPKNMLFARAMSNGAKWHAPGVFGGTPVYTPDELGADVDEDGNMINITPAQTKVVETSSENIEEGQFVEDPPEKPTGPKHITKKQLTYLHTLGNEAYSDWKKVKGPAIMAEYGFSSSNDVTLEAFKTIVTDLQEVIASKPDESDSPQPAQAEMIEGAGKAIQGAHS